MAWLSFRHGMRNGLDSCGDPGSVAEVPTVLSRQCAGCLVPPLEMDTWAKMIENVLKCIKMSSRSHLRPSFITFLGREVPCRGRSAIAWCPECVREPIPAAFRAQMHRNCKADVTLDPEEADKTGGCVDFLHAFPMFFAQKTLKILMSSTDL